MEYCKNCEVELDDDMAFCPLCGLSAGEEPIAVKISKEKYAHFRDKTIDEIENLSFIQKLNLIWKISGIILISGIIITLVINLIISHNINWGKYNLIASLVIFANISIAIFFRKKPLLLIICSLTSLILMFLTIDYLNGDNDWGIKLGIPIVTSVYVLSLVIFVLIRISNQIGFNILAYIFIAIATLLLCIELFVSLYSHQIIILKWSLITGASLIPISGLLFFVHYKLKKGIDLKRFFHI